MKHLIALFCFQQNSKEKKLKREEVLARAKASQRQSDEVFKNLESYLQVCSCILNEKKC